MYLEWYLFMLMHVVFKRIKNFASLQLGHSVVWSR